MLHLGKKTSISGEYTWKYALIAPIFISILLSVGCCCCCCFKDYIEGNVELIFNEYKSITTTNPVVHPHFRALKGNKKKTWHTK